MGEVYEAQHVGIKRTVAIKLLHPRMRDDKDVSERVMREAFATGRLDHPNCVAVSDSGTLADGGAYLVMELLKGESLGESLDRQHSLPLDEALQIMRHVLRGLAHAHNMGVVHRDMKPENIFLVERDGEQVAKILDFGIAKLMGEASCEEGGADLTQAGMAIGSPRYMSPEQALGETLDGRTDLYSLTLLFYEMLTGKPPFYEEDDKMLTLRRRLTEDAPAMKTPSGEGLPTSVEIMVRAGLGRSVDERIGSAEEYLSLVEEEIAALFREDRDLTPRHVERSSSSYSHTDLVRPAPPRRRALYIAGVSLVVVVLIALVARDGDEEMLVMSPDYLEDRISDPVQLAEALTTIEKDVEGGKGAKHIRALQKICALQPDSVRGNRALGLAFTQKRYWQDGFKYLRRAIALDEKTRRDPAVIKAGLRSLSSRSNPEQGVRFLVRDIGVGAIPLLEETLTGGSERQRDNAKRALDQLRP